MIAAYLEFAAMCWGFSLLVWRLFATSKPDSWARTLTDIDDLPEKEMSA